MSRSTAVPTRTALCLISALWPDAAAVPGSRGDKARVWLRNGFLVLAGSLLLMLSAKIEIPFYPVPMTLQTLVVLSLGMACGWRLGGSSVALYLAAGAMGMPVFAGTPEKGIGLVYMLGSTGGYLLGFLLAAAIVGWLAERGWDQSIVKTTAAMLIGNAAIYIPGLFWLGTLFGWDKPIVEWGLMPFILGDLIKLALAAVLFPAAWRAVRRWR